MGIISSIINFGSTLATNHANRQNVRKTNKHQKEMADLEYERNSPLNQMNRFREAGLNPNLIYSQMGDSTYSAPNLQTSESVPVQTDFSDTDLLQVYQDFQLKKVQINNEREVGRGISLDNARKEIENNYLESEKKQSQLHAIETYRQLVENGRNIPLQREKLASEIYVALARFGLDKEKLEFDKQKVSFDHWVMRLVDNFIKSFTGHSVTSQAFTDGIIDSLKNSWDWLSDMFHNIGNGDTHNYGGGSGNW